MQIVGDVNYFYNTETSGNLLVSQPAPMVWPHPIPLVSSLWHQRHIKLLGRVTEECHRKCRLFPHYRDIKGPSDFSACIHGHIQFHAGPHLVPKEWSRIAPFQSQLQQLLSFFLSIYVF